MYQNPHPNAAAEALLRLAVAQLLGEATGLPVAAEPPQPGLDWERALRLAGVHRLQPLLARTPAGDHAPAAIRRRLDDEARRLRIRAAVMTGDFLALHAAFAAAGIPLVPIKGIALAHQIYPSPSLRYHDDLDLLIPAAASGDALPLLRSLGYQPHPNAPLPEWHHLPPYVHPRRGTLVEIHHDLLRRSGPGWPLAGVWQRLVPLDIDGRTVRTLSPPDALVYTVGHARHTLFHRLQGVVDLLLLLPHVDDDGELARLAAEAEVREALAFMLDSAAALLLPTGPTLAPLLARPLLRQGTPRRQRRMVRQVGRPSLQTARPAPHGPRARLLELGLQDSPAAALRLLWRLLRPPPPFAAAVGGYGRRLRRRLRRLLQG